MTEAQRNEGTGDAIKATLGDSTITVPPVKQWRASALEAMTNGQFSVWAEKTLDDDAYDTWLSVDPTVGQIETMFESMSGDLGMSPGESRASSRRSGRTATR